MIFLAADPGDAGAHPLTQQQSKALTARVKMANVVYQVSAIISCMHILFVHDMSAHSACLLQVVLTRFVHKRQMCPDVGFYSSWSIFN